MVATFHYGNEERRDDISQVIGTDVSIMGYGVIKITGKFEEGLKKFKFEGCDKLLKFDVASLPDTTEEVIFEDSKIPEITVEFCKILNKISFSSC